MVPSMTRKMISLAISLLLVVISLTGAALAATAPTVTTLTRYTPSFAGAPGKMARDAVGNFYIADFWGKGIVKLNRLGSRVGFIPTAGRPSAVAVMSDSRLVVAMQAPQAYVAFYSQGGTGGAELSQFTAPATPLYRPSAITIDAAGYIYVLDAGDLSTNITNNLGCVRVYSSTGTYLDVFGKRTNPDAAPASGIAGGYQLKQPMGLVYESVANQIIVADSLNGRLTFYSAFNGTVNSCVFSKIVGIPAGKNWVSTTGTAVKFADPQDIALEYTAGNVLDRLYVAEKATGEIMVVDAVPVTPTTCTATAKVCDNRELKRINGVTTTNGSMVFPSTVLFEKTGATAGVLYVANAASTIDANIVPFSIGGGTVPTLATTISINPLAATTTVSPLAVSGSTSSATVSCSLNGSTTFTPATVNAGTWSISIPSLVSGQDNWITCKTSDAFAQASTYYTVAPQAAPSLAITSPANNSYTKSGSVLVSGTSNSAGVNISIPGSTCSPTGADMKWSCSVTLAEGSNAINVSASKTGTSVANSSVTVVKDTTLPQMVISALNNGSVVTGAVQNIDGIVTEANLAAVEIDGVPVPASAMITLGAGSTYFSTPVTLVRGSNLLTITARDLAGNLLPITRTVTLNPDIPGFTVALPADNSFMTGVSSAAASGSADSGFSSVDAAGSAVTPSLGAWNAPSFTVDNSGLNSGLKMYEFTASGVNATVKAKRTILNGAGYAQIAITSPAADAAIKDSTVIVYGSVAAGSLIPKISIDGGTAVAVTNYNSTDGTFNHTVTLGSEGTHVVQVTDNAVTTKAVRNIVYDKTDPVLGIKADSKNMPAAISGSIEGSASLTIDAKLSGATVAVSPSRVTYSAYNADTDTVVWTADLTSLIYDTISFVTTDPAGNSKLRTRTAILPNGDIDGDGFVRLSDALAALRHSAGTEKITVGTDAFNRGDVGSLIDGRVASDGDVNIVDAVLILKKSNGLLTF